jgi:hypothetical protein
VRISYYLPLGLAEYRALSQNEQRAIREELNDFIDELNEEQERAVEAARAERKE